MYKVIVKLYKKAHGTYLKLVKEEEVNFISYEDAETFLEDILKEIDLSFEYRDIFILYNGKILKRNKTIEVSDKPDYPVKMIKEKECINYEDKLNFIIENRNFFSMKYICEQAEINYSVYKNTYPKLSKNNVRKIFEVMKMLSLKIDNIN